MKLPALNSLNQPVDNGHARNRGEWQKWGTKRMTEQDRKLGFVCVVGQFDCPEKGSYYRVNFAAQPRELRTPKRFIF